MAITPSSTLDQARQGANVRSPLDWGVILAGAVVATAIAFLLFTFGAALGLSVGSFERGEGLSAFWLSVAVGIWFVWVTITSIAAGGYLAGRLRRRAHDAGVEESETRDGAHGVVVWAIALLFGAMIGGGALGGIAQGVGSATGAAAQATASAAGSNVVQEGVDYYAGLLMRGQDGRLPDPAVQQEAAGVLMRSVTEGEVVERDRAYLAQLLASQSGMDPQAARAQIDGALAEVEQARQAAVDAAKTARVAGVVTAFVIAATLAAAAAAAYAAGQLGGRHRDENAVGVVESTRVR